VTTDGALANHSPDQLAALAPRPGFVAGLTCFFRGLGWTLATPQVWPLTMVPAVVGVALSALIGWLAVPHVPGLVSRLIGPTEGTLAGIGVGVLSVLATILVVVAGVFVAFSIAQPLAGPALEALVRRQERALGVPARPETSFLSDVWRSLQSLMVGAMFGLPALALLFLLSFVVPYASIVLFPLKLVVAALMLAWDICDYPLSVRGLPMSQRVGIVFRHFGALLGFGLALALASLVPCVVFLLLPGGVAGAARLMLAIERHEQQAGRDMDGIRRGRVR
jgi:CysZ protein